MAVYNEADDRRADDRRVLASSIPESSRAGRRREQLDRRHPRASCWRTPTDPRVDGRAAGRSPRGKGNAVREGFEHVTGGIILIQDADLEYSVDDYPALIAPITAGEPTSRSAAATSADDRCGSWTTRGRRHASSTPRTGCSPGCSTSRTARGCVTRSRCTRSSGASASTASSSSPTASTSTGSSPAKLVRLGYRPARDPHRVRSPLIRGRQEGPVLPRPADVGRGMPAVPVLLPSQSGSWRARGRSAGRRSRRATPRRPPPGATRRRDGRLTLS